MNAATVPPIDVLLPRLRNVVKTRNGWDALCPAHPDTHPSLGVAVAGDGSILLKCRSHNCTADAIVGAIGLSMRDLFPKLKEQTNGTKYAKPQLGKIVARYPYHDAAGGVMYEVVRFDPKDFRQGIPQANGRYSWKLNGTPRVPYRLRELLAAPPDGWVFVCEGEKDADRLAKLGLVATTNPQGAGKWHTLDVATVRRAFDGRRVAILPDNDAAGRQHGLDVADRLDGIAAEVRVVELPGLDAKGDVSDWFDRGGTREQLLALVEATAPAGPRGEGTGVATAKQEQDGTQPPASTQHLTDVGNAQRVVARWGKDFRFVYPWRQYLAWDGRRWSPDESGATVRMVKETQADLYRQIADRIKALGQEGGDDEDAKKKSAALMEVLKHALKWEDARRIAACLEMMKSEPGVPVSPGQLDSDPFLLNVLNCTLDLRTGQRREHRREDLISKLASVEYDPDAACPLWLKFVDRIMDGNADLIDYLQRVAGYSLTGNVNEQCLFFFYGTGANGKSTYLSTIRDLMGDYACQAVSELLMAKSNEAHPTERADLFGRRFVATIETDEGKRLAEALMKQLTGGDTLKARKLYQDFFEITPTWKLFLAANHKPTIRGADYAVWRRIKLVPFTVTITDEEKDKDLLQKLKGEWPGILAWMVRGCMDWQQHGLGEPEEIKQATDAYQAEQDTIAGFITECCWVHPEARAKAGDLLEAYQKWSGDKLMTQRDFAKRLRERKFEAKRGHGGWVFYRGIGLQETQGEGSEGI